MRQNYFSRGKQKEFMTRASSLGRENDRDCEHHKGSQGWQQQKPHSRGVSLSATTMSLQLRGGEPAPPLTARKTAGRAGALDHPPAAPSALTGSSELLPTPGPAERSFWTSGGVFHKPLSVQLPALPSRRARALSKQQQTASGC